MRTIFRNLIVASITLASITTFAERSRAYIPFSFVVKSQQFPAGYYDVTLDSTRNFLSLVSEADSAKFLAVVTGPAPRAKSDAETVLRFNVVGESHCLSTIQMNTRLSPGLACRTHHSDSIEVQGH